MNRDELFRLMEKYHQGKTTKSETKMVEAFFKKAQNTASQKDLDALLTEGRGQQLFRAIQTKLSKEKKSFAFNKLQKMAAAAVILLAVSVSIKTILTGKNITVYTSSGEQKEIALNDGTVVTLNENSSLSYPKTFKRKRKIELTGQAFFDVKRDEKKPFLVYTKNTEIKVLGTSFDVESYTQKATSVNVITGKVQVASRNRLQDKVVLTRNQQALSTSSGLSVDKPFKNQESIAWANLIVLKNTSLEETAQILKNRFGVTIIFESKGLETQKISGKFKNESLDNILKSMALLKGLRIKYQSQNTIYVKTETN